MLKNKKLVIVFAILFVLLIVTPVVANVYYQFLLKPVSLDSQEEKIFVINPGAAVVDIAQNLKKENLIKNPLAFRFLVSRMGIGENIQAGDFRLSPAMTSKEIAEELTHGAIDVWVTLPEGLRIEEQAQIIEDKLNFDSNNTYLFKKEEYIEIAQEGYMFPDTYLIPKDATANDVVNLLRSTFDQKVESAVFTEGRQFGLTENQLITLGSIIEREAKTDEEKSTIAGIVMNRINDGIALQIDATVQYAKGYDDANQTWWPQVTTNDYKSVKSAYNTYINPGLPPQPIANPGLESILAAASPKETSYYYYLHDSNGNIHYAETIEEHGQNIEEYLLQ